jgi:hypothetical protein
VSKRVKAVAIGFKNGRRVKEGAIFFVDEKAKAKWYIDYPESLGQGAPKEEKGQKTDVNELMM